MVKDPYGFFEDSRRSVVQKDTITSLIESSANDRPAPRCRKVRNPCELSSARASQCIDCAFLDDMRATSSQEAAFLRRCRAIQEFVERTAIHHCSAHVATVVLSSSAHVVQYNTHGLAFLQNNDAISIRDGRLCCSDSMCQARFSDAISKAINSGKTNLLVHAVDHPDQRLSVSLVRVPELSTHYTERGTELHAEVVCLIARLDRRRFATARQLMELFGLSTSEARLARAVCHGESLEQYAVHNGLKMPTVRTQLRSVFAKTVTDRQSTLVRLLSGVPVVR